MADSDHDAFSQQRQPSPERQAFERRLAQRRRKPDWTGLRLERKGWTFADGRQRPWQQAWRADGHFGAVRRMGALAGALRALSSGVVARGLHQAWQGLSVAGNRLVGAVRRAPWRRLAQASALTAASGLAMASVLATSGYADNPPAWGLQRLDQRTGHGVFDGDGTLLGATWDRVVLPAGGEVDHTSFGHVPAHAPLPPLYVRLLLTLEHQSHFDPWRNWCGTDVLALAKRVATGTGGGSTFAHQLAKQLLEPDVRRSNFGPEAMVQKMREWGVGCSLHRALGGPDGVLRAFADTAPVAQVRGTTRGPVSGAQVLFGVSLERATPAQLAVLAALVQRPMSVVPESAFTRGCDALRAADGSDAGPLAQPERRAKAQCHVLARARFALRRNLPAGPDLDAALAQIAAWERTGLQPQDSFAAVPARRLVNVSERGRQLLGGTLLQHVATLADEASVPGGHPLTLSLTAPDQLAFRTGLNEVLREVDASPRAAELLCVTLLPETAPRHCQGAPAGSAVAELVLVRARIADGGVVTLHHTSLQAYERPRQMGSLAKMVVLLAAVRQGMGPDTRVCPRAAKANGRVLRRETRPHLGVQACTPAEHITLAQATATSDNLAFYELARRLGEPALQQAMAALGLAAQDGGGSLAFALAFGTQPATPAQMLAMGQALFGVAYGVPARAAAPQLLQLDPPTPATAWHAVATLLPSAGQRSALGSLLQAPVSEAGGTLVALAPAGAAAGKSGTASSAFTGPGLPRPYQQARLSLTYQPADRSVALAIVAGSEPQPLGQWNLPAQLIQPIRMALLR